MTLESWVANGWLEREPTSPEKISSLLSVLDRGLADSAVEAISQDLRFIAAFGAALAAVTIPLRASGYRLSTQAGHHLRTIDSLELTAGADSKLIQRLKALNNKRNRTNYEVSGAVSDQGLIAIRRLVTQLKRDVIDWLKTNQPELRAR